MMSASFLRSVVFALAVLMMCGTGRPADPSQRDLLKTFLSEFVEITPGEDPFPKSFVQGPLNRSNPNSTREVTWNHSFAISKYETTQDLYESVIGTNPSRWKGPRNAVDSVSWNDAAAFCDKMTSLLRSEGLIDESTVIRLPSESEWEYACRAGTDTAYSFGDQARAAGDPPPKAKILDAYAWHTGNAAGNDPVVGALKPNAWGLYDAHGYLWEYCQDDWHTSGTAPTNGSAWRDEPRTKRRVIKGGSWKNDYSLLGSTVRLSVVVSDRNDAMGFRCVKATERSAPTQITDAEEAAKITVETTQ